MDAIQYSILGAGKRIRPLLCLCSATAVGGDALDAVDVACAIECVHCFSLIHDDLPCIDNDDLRRGRPTVHKVYGEGLALLAGDALFAFAFEILAACRLDSAQKATLFSILSQAVGTRGLVGGEALDVLSEGAEPQLDLLHSIHRRKTGALISSACAMGAVAGRAPMDLVDRMRDFGAHLGMAFQIADDILNVTSTPEQLGKAVGSDAKRGKLTYPAAVGLQRSQEMMLEEARSAKKLLSGLPGRSKELRVLVDFAVERRH